MIDASKCVWDETHTFRNPDRAVCGVVHYFSYQTDWEETGFDAPESYGHVIGMELALESVEDGAWTMRLSPTVEETGVVTDVDWHELYEGVNYTAEIVASLLKKIKFDWESYVEVID